MPVPGGVVSWAALVLAVQEQVARLLSEEPTEVVRNVTLTLVGLLFLMIFEDRPPPGSGRQ